MRYLEDRQDEIRGVLPDGMPLERFLRMVIAVVRSDARLLTCTPESVLTACLQAAQIGLTPGSALGECIIEARNTKQPDGSYKTEARLVLTYQGLLALLYRHNSVRWVDAQAVFERDTFRLTQGTQPKVIHEPCIDGDPGRMIGAYAVAELPSGRMLVEYMPRAEVEKVRAHSRTGGAWDEWFSEMARKAVLRRLVKRIPKSPAVEAALAQDQDMPFGVEPEEAMRLLPEAGQDKDEETPTEPLPMPLPEQSQPEPEKTTPPQSPAGGGDTGPTQSQVTMWNQHCRRLRLTQAQQEALLKEKTGKTEFAQLTRAEATAVIKMLIDRQ